MKSSINFRVIKGGLKLSGSLYFRGKLTLKNRAPYMVHLGASRLTKFLENRKLCQYSGHISEICHPKMWVNTNGAIEICAIEIYAIEICAIEICAIEICAIVIYAIEICAI
jgi:hypothetical protein